MQGRYVTFASYPARDKALHRRAVAITSSWFQRLLLLLWRTGKRDWLGNDSACMLLHTVGVTAAMRYCSSKGGT
jgi:hypothetical protein